MRNVEGGSKAEKHSRSGSLEARVYCSTQCSRARTQYTQTCSSRGVISPESSEAGQTARVLRLDLLFV